jgi:hypothetical protein
MNIMQNTFLTGISECITRIAHDMRNEFAEKFLPVLRGTRELNRRKSKSM